MMVYPNQVFWNQNWTTNTGVDILLALGENDDLYVYNTSSIASVFLGMPLEVVNCQLRLRSLTFQNPSLHLGFYRGGVMIGSATIPTTNNWQTHTLTVDRWDSVTLSQLFSYGTLAVDFIRAEQYGGFPTKRTLTGVGV